MAMNVGPGDGEEDALNSNINTTPLVDVMLVLLIIFLITIPVVTHTIPLVLPKETNQARQTKPENINISINREGDVFWNQQPVADMESLVAKLKTVSVKDPQPEVQIRGDENVRARRHHQGWLHHRTPRERIGHGNERRARRW